MIARSVIFGWPLPWSEFCHDRAKITPVETVVMAGTGEFCPEGPKCPGSWHAVWPADPLLVVPEPSQVTVQPARPDAGPVLSLHDRPEAPLPIARS